MALEVAQTILRQLSLDTRLAVSARDYAGTEDSLTFRFGSRYKRLHATVTLDRGSDTYNVKVVRVPTRGKNAWIPQTIREFSWVYADDLPGLIREVNNELF